MNRPVVAVLALLTMWAPATPVRAQGYHLIGAPEVYTQVNLHPDEKRQRLYSVNYQQPGLLPLCTRVTIESVTSGEMVFAVVDGGRKYTYIFHNSLQDPIAKHLDRYFGVTCNRARVDALSKIDRDGVLAGQVRIGMSKDAVILAIGYPPEHMTPRLDAGPWRYWKNRFNTFLVHFEGDVVSRIQD
jgi:hypothetical protein